MINQRTGDKNNQFSRKLLSFRVPRRMLPSGLHMNFLKLEHMHAKFEHVCKTHNIAVKSVDMLFVKQECSTL